MRKKMVLVSITLGGLFFTQLYVSSLFSGFCFCKPILFQDINYNSDEFCHFRTIKLYVRSLYSKILMHFLVSIKNSEEPFIGALVVYSKSHYFYPTSLLLY